MYWEFTVFKVELPLMNARIYKAKRIPEKQNKE
jgi:hypothetical protein